MVIFEHFGLSLYSKDNPPSIWEINYSKGAKLL